MPQMMPIYWVIIFFLSLWVFFLIMSSVFSNVFFLKKVSFSKSMKFNSWLK